MSSRVNGQSTSKVPHTSFGKPDLGGICDFATITPLERPPKFAGKEFLTESEARTLEALWTVPEPTYTATGTYNRWWTDDGTRVVKTRRTSLIVDPPDGKLPALTPEVEKRAALRRLARERPAGPEAFSLAYACHEGNYAMENMLRGARAVDSRR